MCLIAHGTQDRSLWCVYISEANFTTFNYMENETRDG